MPPRADAPRTTEVRILADRFEPKAVEVEAGDAVTWTNADTESHTVSSAEIESGPIDPGASFRHGYERPGRHRYFCMRHPRVVGDVYVR